MRLDLEAELAPGERFDLVVSTMVMHHIVDPKAVLAKLASPVKAGGWLAISDLDSDGGEFQNDPAGVIHNGFERHEIKACFRDVGLANVADFTAMSFEKEVQGKGVRPFSTFLVTELKPASAIA